MSDTKRFRGKQILDGFHISTLILEALSVCHLNLVAFGRIFNILGAGSVGSRYSAFPIGRAENRGHFWCPEVWPQILVLGKALRVARLLGPAFVLH